LSSKTDIYTLIGLTLTNKKNMILIVTAMEENNQTTQQPVSGQINNMNQTTPTPAPQKKGFPLKTLLLIIFLTIIAFGLIALALYKNSSNKKNPTPVVKNAVPQEKVSPAQTTLTISSTLIKLSTPSAYSSEITINTGQNAVNEVQLEILYDPKVLTKVDITAGKFFTDPKIILKNIDKDNGRITFALGIQDHQNGLVGQGALAKLSFLSLIKTGSTSAVLLPKTQARADNIAESVLKTTIDGLFSFNNNTLKSSSSGR
jgi:hypothetical protein